MKFDLIRTGDACAILRWKTQIDLETHDEVVSAFHHLKDRQHPGIRNLHPAYCSLLIDFDPLQISFARLSREIRELLGCPTKQKPPDSRTIEIPVVYGGPDLDEVARLRGLSVNRVIELHTAPIYRVYFLGFQPGFPYLGGLAPELETPRLSVPRVRVPAGSVGIAGNQTGIYPFASPGGWRLLGITDVTLFNPASSPPTLLQMGDRVRFTSARREA